MRTTVPHPPFLHRTLTGNLVQALDRHPAHSTFGRALPVAMLVELLSATGPFTVFAPTDAAFTKLPTVALEALLQNPVELRRVLSYHVLRGAFTTRELAGTPTRTSIEGAELTFDLERDTVVNDARILVPDQRCTNGVLHSIDTVLVPEDLPPPQRERG